MANQTVYPYGTGGSLPSSIGLVNDLTTGGVDKALTAEMGKQLGTLIDQLDLAVNGTSSGDYEWVDIDLDTGTPINSYIHGTQNKWLSSTTWCGRIFQVVPGQKYKITASPSALTNYAFLRSGPVNNLTPYYATGSSFSGDIAAGQSSPEETAPNDANYLYVLTHTGSTTENEVTIQTYASIPAVEGLITKVNNLYDAVDDIFADGTKRVCEGDTTKDNVFHDLQSAVNACQDDVLTTISIDGDLHIGTTITIPSTKKIRLVGGCLKGSVFSPAMRRKDTGNVAKIYIGSLKPQWIEVDGVVKYPASSKRAYLYKCTFSSTGAQNSNVTTTFTIPTADATKLSASGYSNAWVTILDRWMAHKFRIDNVNTSNGTLTITYYNGKQSYHATTGSLRMILENVNIESAEINDNSDTWGEGTFYYTGGYLYYKYSANDSAPNIEIPNIETLIVSNGYLMMDGVKVSMTAHDFDNLMGEGEGHGYRSLQSGFVINGAIDIGGAADITSCTFTHTTNNAIRVLNTAENVTIDNCTFEEVGTDAILVGVTNYIAYNKGQMPDYVPITIPINVNIIGNSVHHPGRVYQEASAIAMAYARGFYIGKNVISDTYYTGISTGLDWKATSTQGNRNGIVEGNLLKNIGVGYCALRDGSAFYNLGEEINMIFRNNIINEVYGDPHSTNSINSLYFDEGSRNVTAQNNIVYDTYGFVFFNIAGPERGITVTNNIFALPKKAINTENEYLPDAVTHNIFAWNGTKTSVQSTTGTYVGNLYYRYDGTATASFDTSAVIGNPGFRDVNNYDFDIVDQTNTSQISFVPFSLKGPSMELIMRTKNSPEDESALAEWKTRWNNGTL